MAENYPWNSKIFKLFEYIKASQQQHQGKTSIIAEFISIITYMAQPFHLRKCKSPSFMANLTYIEPAGIMSGEEEDDELVRDTSPLTHTDDGKVVIPMHVFHSVIKKKYDDAWATTAVRYLPAFTPAAFDKETGQVDLTHICSKDTKKNRAKILAIVRDDLFGSGLLPFVRSAYAKYIKRLYSNEIYGETEEGDYPFELGGRVPVSQDDLYDTFFGMNGPGMKLKRDGEWDRLCAWCYIVCYWVTSETHDGEWIIEGLKSYYDSKKWNIFLDCSHDGRKNRSVHPLVRIAKKKACDHMKTMFRKKMAIMWGRTLKFQGEMSSPLGLDEREVDIGRYLPKVIKSTMMRVCACRFRMKLARENGGSDLEMKISVSVHGAAKAAMEGGMAQEDIEELVGNVIRGVYEKDDEGVDKASGGKKGPAGKKSSKKPGKKGPAGKKAWKQPVSPTLPPPMLPPMPASNPPSTPRAVTRPLFPVAQTYATPQDDGVRRSPRGKGLAASLVAKLDKANASSIQSEKRGEKRVVATVDDDLVAAKPTKTLVGWKRGTPFLCYHCPHAFSKDDECVFVFCTWCHGDKLEKVMEKKRGEIGTSNANKRRGGRGRASAGVKEVNVCDNLKRGECGRHTWGDLEHLRQETNKLWTWREQTKKLGDETGFIAKHCFGCGNIL